jgi:hypothetical protein
VIGVFDFRAARAGSRGGDLMLEPPVVHSQAMFPGEPKEGLALKRCHAFPNLQNLHILLQMLKMMAIEIFVCKAFISVTTQASIQVIRGGRR